MTAVLVSEEQGEALPVVTSGAPTATSSPSVRTSLLDEVWTASARVEGLQWEMDEARDCLATAMRAAAAAGAGLPDLAIAAGLGFADIEQFLNERLEE